MVTYTDYEKLVEQLQRCFTPMGDEISITLVGGNGTTVAIPRNADLDFCFRGFIELLAVDGGPVVVLLRSTSMAEEFTLKILPEEKDEAA